MKKLILIILILPISTAAKLCDGTRLSDYMNTMIQEGVTCVVHLQRFGTERMWNGDACTTMRDQIVRAERENKRLKADGCTKLSNYDSEKIETESYNLQRNLKLYFDGEL